MQLSSTDDIQYSKDLNATTDALLTQLQTEWTKNPGPPLSDITIEQYRQDGVNLFEPWQGPIADVERKTMQLPGAEGNTIETTIFNPDHDGPCLLFFAGGAFVSRLAHVHHAALSRLAKSTGWMIIAPDCRLAPEHPLPAGSKDAFAVLEWLYQNGKAALNINPQQIALAGDSHGGNFVLLTSLKAKAAGIPIWFQMPISPATDLSRLDEKGFDQTEKLLRFKSYEQKDILVSQPLVEKVYPWALPAGQDPKDPVFSPLYAAELKGLAPTITLVAGNDGLLRDSLLYVDRQLAEQQRILYSTEPSTDIAAMTKAITQGQADGALCIFPGQIHSFLIAREVLNEGDDPTDIMSQVMTGFRA